MTLVPRRVRKVPPPGSAQIEGPVEGLEAFRHIDAWVLLGEPGAGKSESFRSEAAEPGGQYLSVAEFVNADLDPAWRGKTLFLDGLDEVRASGSTDSTLQLLRNQLKRLEKPSFRIACRAADWYGSTDRDDLKSVSPNGKISVLLLEPLDSDDVLTLLRDNHNVTDPQAFVAEAENRGVADLLDNPQTLGMLAGAIRGDAWPETRNDSYRLACGKLAEEANKRHRDRVRDKPRSTEKLLDAGGQLCAVLLLSDKTGIALDVEQVNDRFVSLDDCSPPDSEAASQTIRSKLFRPESEERVVPSHRSIAEYLAARWLAGKIDKEGLPLGRVLNLLLGRDGRAVAGLRGLYGWLALHCIQARPRLIEADPLTTVVYGDVKPMPVGDKKHILKRLRHEAERFTAFRWTTATAHPFGALADAGLHADFLAILNSPNRDDASQSLADCVLEILIQGNAQPELAMAVLSIVRDDTRWPAIRKHALDVLFKLTSDPQTALGLLDDVTEGRVSDRDDELAGKLLRKLYPVHLGPEALLRHLHLPKDDHPAGNYCRFWGYDLGRSAPASHLPALLDGLVERRELLAGAALSIHSFGRMAGALLARGINVHGDNSTDERLFNWLGIGADEYGGIRREDAEQQAIASWLSARPERYKAVLQQCFSMCEKHKHPAYCIDCQAARLHAATAPSDLGLWHLEQAVSSVGDELAETHLAAGLRALSAGQDDPEQPRRLLEAWGAAHPGRRHLVARLVAPRDISPLENDWEVEAAAREEKRGADKRARTLAVTPHLPAIRDGTARVDLLHDLTNVWANRYSGMHGQTAAERFNKYCENGNEVLTAAEAGFRRCPERPDLPTVQEIVALSINQKEHLVRLACLVGMGLRWQDGRGEIERLSEDTLRSMIAFRLTYSAGETPAWFIFLVQHRPEWVAGVLTAYASATLKAGKEYVDSIHELEHDQEYRKVATLAAPRLIETFPVRARIGQLNYLENLLKAALRYARDRLPEIVRKKLRLKGMDSAQKVYWHATALLLDPADAEAALWRYVGKSESRANYLTGFLCGRNRDLSREYDLPARTIGGLIEICSPNAQVERPRGGFWVTDEIRRGDQMRAMITRLGTMKASGAEKEIDRLLMLPALKKLKYALVDARHQQKLRQRESEFHFLPPKSVAQVLANKAPASTADLTALTLDHLDTIGEEIRHGNDDGYRGFWNITKKQPTGQRDENLCRDVLLTRLRTRLSPFDVDCQPEGDYARDNKADLRLSHRSDIEVPIEIKRDSHRELWTNLRTQLIEKYAIAPGADGHGIYLVLWFGGAGMPGPQDGGKRPQTANELRERLEAQLDPIERQRIAIRVLDVSFPPSGRAGRAVPGRA